MKRFTNHQEILHILRGFEDAAIDRSAWKHAEHLTVALCYVSENELETAVNKMRSGLFNLLTNGFMVDLTKEMPYHETLTVFWMRTVAEFNSAKSGLSLLDRANELVDVFDKDYPMKFYSREFLFSDEARTKFVEGDLGNR